MGNAAFSRAIFWSQGLYLELSCVSGLGVWDGPLGFLFLSGFIMPFGLIIGLVCENTTKQCIKVIGQLIRVFCFFYVRVQPPDEVC